MTQAGGLLDGHGFQITRHGPPPPPPPPPPCSGRITIPEIGPAAPYPSTCSISGLSGTITDANLVLNGLSHFTPDDIDILLVGPQGQDAMMMSDAGGGFAAQRNRPDARRPGRWTAAGQHGNRDLGSYRPANYEPGDPFPAPAPTPTGNVALSTFDGTSPNGTWSLYVVDDALGSIGSINGWRLQITTAGAPPPPPPPPPPRRLRLRRHRHRRPCPRHLPRYPRPHRRPLSSGAWSRRVVGLTLRKARTRIRAKHCSVGRIRRARSRRVGRVIAQSPRPGRRLARGSRVNLVLGRR